MIDRQLLTKTVEDFMSDTDLFPVEISIAPGNVITVEIDSPTGVDIDTCVGLTRKIEQTFDREVEDYELEVGSAGLTSPFKVKAQYDKNIGNELEILTKDGRKLYGALVETSEDGFTVEIPVKVKKEGAKRPVVEMQPETFAYGDCKTVRYNLNFK